MPPKHPQRTAFTLVELLVVIGIITLLISILLPSLNRARQSAANVKCQSNLRQVGMALLMYANENKQHLPNFAYYKADGSGAVFYDPIGTDIYNPSAGLWTEAIHRYLQQDKRVAVLGQARNYNFSMNVLRCPSAPEVQGNDNYFTYGANYFIPYSTADQAARTPGIFNYFQLTGNSLRYNGSRLLTRIRPTEFLVCDILKASSVTPPYAWNVKNQPPDTDTDGDGILDTSASLYNTNKPYGKYNYVDFRHPKKAMNYVCVDGSVHSALIPAWFNNDDNAWSKP